MTHSKVRVGSLRYWAMVRAAQGMMVCIGLSFYFVERPLSWPLAGILFVWSLLTMYLDSYVYGFADEDGIRFRRYLLMHVIPWSSVRRLSWFGPTILSIHLKSGFLFRRELNANSAPKSFRVNPADEPELVRWVQFAKPSEAVGLELRPWGTDTIASRRMRTVLTILIPLVSVAILIWLVATLLSARS